MASPEYFFKIRRHHDASFARRDYLVAEKNLKGLRVIDIYCGIGFDAVSAARAGSYAVFAASATSHAELTLLYAKQNGIRISVVVVDPERLPFKNSCFDLVLARGVLMYSPRPGTVVSEIYRVLSQKGQFCALRLNRWSWYPLLAKVSGTPLIQEPVDPPYVRLDTTVNVKNLFRNARDFRIIHDRFPRRTSERSGFTAFLFNSVFLPLFNLLPKSLADHLAYYLIVIGRKPSTDFEGDGQDLV